MKENLNEKTKIKKMSYKKIKIKTRDEIPRRGE